MATLTAVIVPAKALKGGRHKIRIAVAHRGETRYIVTDITIDSDREFKNGAIVKRPDASMMNVKLRGLLTKYQMSIDELEYVDAFSCAELVTILKNGRQTHNRTLGSVVEEFIDSLVVKSQTAKNYYSRWRRISKSLNGSMLISHITYISMIGLRNYLVGKRLKPSTISTDMSLISSVFCYARKCGYVGRDFSPMEGIKLPEHKPRQSWLTVEEVKKIRDLEVKGKKIRYCRDIFMLSYYLGGINMADLVKINFNDHPGTLHYIRQKTELRAKLNEFVEFKIPREAIEIIERYKQSDGRLPMSESQRASAMQAFLRQQLTKIAELTGIKNLVYYSARKSFSQHAFVLGINQSVIDYILGHKIDKGSTIYNYIYVTPQMATEAVRKVLDNLK